MKKFIVMFSLCLAFSGPIQAAGTAPQSLAQAVSKQEVADLKKQIEIQRKEIQKFKGTFSPDVRAAADMKKNINEQNKTITDLSNKIEKLLNLIEIHGNTVKFIGNMEVTGAAEFRGDIQAEKINADDIRASGDLRVGNNLKVDNDLRVNRKLEIGNGVRIENGDGRFDGNIKAEEIKGGIVKSNNKELVPYGAKVIGNISVPGIGSIPVVGTALTVMP